MMCFLVLQLETAIANEMAAFVEEWEVVLDELEIESAHLLVCLSFFL